jgi:hypothetical protein
MVPRNRSASRTRSASPRTIPLRLFGSHVRATPSPCVARSEPLSRSRLGWRSSRSWASRSRSAAHANARVRRGPVGRPRWTSRRARSASLHAPRRRLRARRARCRSCARRRARPSTSRTIEADRPARAVDVPTTVPTASVAARPRARSPTLRLPRTVSIDLGPRGSRRSVCEEMALRRAGCDRTCSDLRAPRSADAPSSLRVSGAVSARSCAGFVPRGRRSFVGR